MLSVQAAALGRPGRCDAAAIPLKCPPPLPPFPYRARANDFRLVQKLLFLVRLGGCTCAIEVTRTRHRASMKDQTMLLVDNMGASRWKTISMMDGRTDNRHGSHGSQFESALAEWGFQGWMLTF